MFILEWFEHQSKTASEAGGWDEISRVYGVHFVSLTIEEIALGLQYLTHVADPSLADVQRQGVQDKSHRAAISPPRRQGKTIRVTVYTHLHAQTTYLKEEAMLTLANILRNVETLCDDNFL